MEEWQRKQIQSNIGDLIENTLCDVVLLSKLRSGNIIERADYENIRKNPTDPEKADQLYTILQTRISGYEALAKALYECKQTAAFVILLNGMRENEIKNPFKSCNIKPGLELLLQVTLRGVSSEVRDWFPKLSDDEFENLMSGLIQNNAYEVLIRFMQNRRDIQLTSDTTFLKVPDYYIPRFISNRLKLSPEIFKQNLADVFVFRGLSRSDLTTLVSKNTESSSFQLKNITVNYILLDNEEDFQDICSSAGDRPVHLISVEAGKQEKEFILEESTGNSVAVWKYVLAIKPDQKCYLSENDFVSKIENWERNHNGFCICDSPGMGKSWLLKSLARKLSERHPDRLVIFVPLVKLVKHLKSGETTLNIVLKHAFLTDLAQAFAQAAMKFGSLKLELFLDGFDEVPEENVELTKQFINSVAFGEESVRIFVASRRHLRNDLEKTLQVIAYDIRPFDEITQVEFLVKYWLSNTSIEPTGTTLERLKDFGRACQKQLRTTLSVENLTIMGIPLQCYILAEVTKLDAARYAQRHNTSLSAILDLFTSVPKMYETFVNMKLEAENTGKMQKARDVHLCLALKEFSVDLGMMLGNTMKIDLKKIPKQILSIGIVESNVSGKDHSVPSFIHRTFAEYFLAELFYDVITGRRLLKEENCELRSKLLQFFVSFIFSVKQDCDHEIIIQSVRLKLENTFPEVKSHQINNSVVVLFLDWHLKKTATVGFLNDFVLALGTCNTLMTPSKILKVLNFCIWKGYVNIIRLLKSQLECQKLTNKDFDTCWKKIVTGSYCNANQESKVYAISHALVAMTIASAYGNKEVISEVKDFFKDLFDFDVGEEIAKCPNWLKTPLHFIIRRGSYTLTEYFLTSISPNLFLKHRALTWHCFSETADEPCPSKIIERIEIYKLLYVIENSMLDEPCYDKIFSPTGTLVYFGLHVEIIKFLLTETNANKFTTVSYGSIIKQRLGFLHVAAQYLSGDDYYELCRFVENKFPEMQIFQPKPIWDSLLHWVLNWARELPEKTLHIFLANQWKEQMNVKNECGLSLLFSAVYGNRSLDIIKMLIDRGTDINMETDDKDNSILYYAVSNRNIEVTRFLVAHGQSLNQQNKHGKTPLHQKYISFEMINYCVRAGADISIQDKKGRTFVHRIVLGEVHCVKYSPECLQEIIELLFNVAKDKTIQVLRHRTLYHHLIINFSRTTVKTLKLLLTTFCPKPEELIVNATHLVSHVTRQYYRSRQQNEKEYIIRILVDYGIALKSNNEHGIDEVCRKIQENCSPDLHKYLLEKNWLQNGS